MDNQQIGQQAQAQANAQLSKDVTVQANQTNDPLAGIEDLNDFWKWYHNKRFNEPDAEGNMQGMGYLPLSDGLVSLSSLECVIPGFKEYEQMMELNDKRHKNMLQNYDNANKRGQLHGQLLDEVANNGGLMKRENRAALGEANQAMPEPKYDEKSQHYEMGGQALPVPNIQNTTVDARTTVNTGQQNQEDPNKKTYLQTFVDETKNVVDEELKQNGFIQYEDDNGNSKNITAVDFSEVSNERAQNINDDRNMVTVTFDDNTTAKVPLYSIVDSDKVVNRLKTNPAIGNQFGNSEKLDERFLKKYDAKELFRNLLNSGEFKIDAINELAGLGDAAANKFLKYYNDIDSTRDAERTALMRYLLQKNMAITSGARGGTYATKEEKQQLNEMIAATGMSNDSAYEMIDAMLGIMSSSTTHAKGNDAAMRDQDYQNADLRQARQNLAFNKLMLQYVPKTISIDNFMDTVTSGKSGESPKGYFDRIYTYKIEQNGKYTKINKGDKGLYRVDAIKNKAYKFVNGKYVPCSMKEVWSK